METPSVKLALDQRAGADTATLQQPDPLQDRADCENGAVLTASESFAEVPKDVRGRSASNESKGSPPGKTTLR